MGTFPSKHLTASELLELRTNTGLSQYQIQRLYSRFQFLDRRQCGGLCPSDLLRIPELVLNPLRQRIIDAIFRCINGDGDVNGDNLNFRQFLHVCGIFMTPKYHEALTVEQRRQQRQRKVRFLYSVIDLRGEGCIRRGDLFDVLLLVRQHQLGVWRHDHIVGLTNGWPRTLDAGRGNGGDEAPLAERTLRDGLNEVLNFVFGGREQIAYDDFDALIEELDLDRLMGIAMWHDLGTTMPTVDIVGRQW